MSIKQIIKNKIDFKKSLSVLKNLEKSDLHPIDIVNKYEGLGEYKSIKPKQVRYEIETLYNRVKDINPKVICEVGTYRGGTLYLWCKIANENAEIFSLDLEGGLDNAFSKNRRKLYSKFIKSSQKLSFIVGDSHSKETALILDKKLAGKQIDFLFIDGDHSYKGAKQDFENYLPFVRKGGIIAFHDILPRPDFDNIEVDKLWNEVKGNFKHEEIINKEGEFANFIGIGILYK